MEQNNVKYVLSKELLQQYGERNGFRSFGEICEAANIHKNSLTPYLKGDRSPYTQVVLDLARVLNVAPSNLVDVKAGDVVYDLQTMILPIVEDKELAFFMFGSRARRTEKKFSDIDIGITGGMNKLDFEKFVLLKSEIEDLFENYPYTLNIVNLDIAPDDFLLSIEKDLTFIFGNKECSQFFLGYVNGRKKN